MPSGSTSHRSDPPARSLAKAAQVAGLWAALSAAADPGAIFASIFQFIDPFQFDFSISIMVLAMVIIGGMRSLLGPALGALFYILFREYLSIWTPHWLFYFGLLFIGFIVFSPTGLVGVAGRLLAPFRAPAIEPAAMAIH